MTPDAPVRVLVLEDEDSIRRLTVDLLTDEGFEVRAAPDGRQGLAILDEWRPDVIVLDLMMPVMDGRAFHAALRSAASGSRVPIVVLSGARQASVIGEELGAVATIVKPFDLDEFVAAVSDAARAGAA
ncbi:MAG: response regulator transcription factor [Dehalococcoidia bacterium]